MIIVHQNIQRGIRNKIDMIEIFILKNRVEIFGITEIGLKNNVARNIKNFEFVSNKKSENRRVGVYI